MDKAFADEMINKYQKKFFGFALNKCSSFIEAEELASRITCEAYMTLRTVEEVYNWEGYLYRIAHNVYVHYVREQAKHRKTELDENEPIEHKDYAAEYADKEELEVLKREVAWLGKRHREIILLHYYHNKKIKEIAELLELPEGTVKWHLSDAKAQLKEGIRQMRRKGNLGIEPIKMTGFSHIGTPGELGDTADFLASKLRQNIAFAAYYEPKTVEEIAEELGVSPVFIEDEIEYLADYGYLDLLPGQRYRTNVFIEKVPSDIYAKSKELSKEIARVICDVYVPELLEELKDWGEDVYVPDNDRNYWYWTQIAKRMTCMGADLDLDKMKKNNYYVKRKDGGEYAACAVVDNEEIRGQLTKADLLNGPMWTVPEKRKIGTWILGTGFDDRVFGWGDNPESDALTFELFLKGQLPKVEALLDKYVRLYDRGYIVNRNGKDMVNVIVQKETAFDETFMEKGFISKQLPDAVNKKIEELLQKKILLEKPYYPGHMHEMLNIWHRLRLVRPNYVLEELLNRGVLKPLTEEQKKGVLVIVYSDVLPTQVALGSNNEGFEKENR